MQHEANLSQLGAATEKYHRRACKEAHDGLSSTVDDQRVYVYVNWSMLLQRGLEVTYTLLEGRIIM